MKYKPDTMDTLAKSDLVQLSRQLLEATVESTKILNKKEMTEKDLKEAKLVLGFLNAADKTMHTKMNYFKMMGVGAKVKAVRARSKNL